MSYYGQQCKQRCLPTPICQDQLPVKCPPMCPQQWTPQYSTKSYSGYDGYCESSSLQCIEPCGPKGWQKCRPQCEQVCLPPCPPPCVTKCPPPCVTKCPQQCVTECVTKCPPPCVTKCPQQCVTECVTKCPQQCVTKCPQQCVTKGQSSKVKISSNNKKYCSASQWFW
ncbi:PREDICTED: small proline-rich protein 2B-like isoform X3 [Crocodylus porosus]|uniref:small proline-rich protein 2B-like isoform X3 n=1 Tax=Crocodylus porosus TaxID=8502 RepID=UPI00093C4E64|nr:PREDICTED: small proline-rich protein 2B-like isoform X3 [Crocodylus porosus]